MKDISTGGLIALHIEVSVNSKEICDWSPYRTMRFFNGIATVMSAVNAENTTDQKLLRLMPEFDPNASQEIRDLWWRQWNDLIDRTAAKREG